MRSRNPATSLSFPDGRRHPGNGAIQAHCRSENVSINEVSSKATFRKADHAGVLIIEAMAQTGGLLLLQEVPDAKISCSTLSPLTTPFPPPGSPGRSPAVRSRLFSCAALFANCAGLSWSTANLRRSDPDVQDGGPRPGRVPRPPSRPEGGTSSMAEVKRSDPGVDPRRWFPRGRD